MTRVAITGHRGLSPDSERSVAAALRGLGGTAEVVDAARDAGIPVVVVWPAGAERR